MMSSIDANTNIMTSASNSSNSTRRPNCRELVIDLGRQDSRKALEILLTMDKRREKVRQARVFTSTGYINNGATGMVEILELLARLPNLKHLTMDFYETLPLQALCFLCHAPKLKSLHLENVHLSIMSDDNDDVEEDSCSMASMWKEDSQLDLWSTILSTSQQLQELTLMQCQGTAAIEQLIAKGLPESLEKLTLARLPFGQNGQAMTETIQALFHGNTRLQSLRLCELHGLQDHHVQTLANEISKTSSALQRFEFSSSTVGSVAGQALTQALTHHQSTQLESFKLHIDWEHCGKDIAQLLLALPKQLKQLDLKLYGDDNHVRADVLAIVQALKTCQLKRLRLCMEVEAISVTEDDSLEIMTAFDEMLQTNDALKYLVLDDTLEEFLLPPTIQSKLRLNQSGAPKLWRRSNSNSNNTPTHDEFVQAVINATKKDLNTIYQILSQEPTLCCAAAATAASNQENATKAIMAADKTHSLSQPPSLPKRINTHDKAKKFIKRQMKSIFAKSA